MSKYHKKIRAGVSSLGVPRVPQIGKSDNLISPSGTDYAHLITTGTPGFPDLPTALQGKVIIVLLCNFL